MAELASDNLPNPLVSSASISPNTTSWYNLTSWAVNVTRYAPLFEDLVWAGPRMFRRLGSFISLNEALDDDIGQPQLPTPSPRNPSLLRPDLNIYNIMEPDLLATVDGESVAQASQLSGNGDGTRGFGSVFSYATSKWAISCIIMAIVLNRTHIFAATRRRSRFRWQARFILRFIPVVLLFLQARSLLQSIQCQTSQDFSQLRWGNSSRTSDLMFSHVNSFLNSISSTILLGSTDQESCLAVSMIPSKNDTPVPGLRGSLSLLWPLFGTFCLSHFLETLSCAVQGRPIATETGMTLFEQSLAFAEADAAASSQLPWGTFTKTHSADAGASQMGTSIALTRSMILKRVNTPAEVLLVAFLSTMTHMTSHLLGIFDLQARYRLVNTGFWALCFMGSIVWSAMSFDLDDPARQGLLRFPTVCIIGFVPHVLVFAGIVMCAVIYALALVLSAFTPSAPSTEPPLTFRQRLAAAHENMQANISLSEIRVTHEMDFYTALLRTGFAAITMASEAVYLNEDRGVSLTQRTWLEEARLREVEEMQRQWMGMGLPTSKYDQIGAIGLIPVKGGPLLASNGYSRERAAQKVSKGRGERGLRVGVGASERSSRWLLALDFLFSINKLLARLFAISALWFLRVLRIRTQPRLLLWLARRPKTDRDGASKPAEGPGQERNSIDANQGSVLMGERADVEAEFRRVEDDVDEENMDNDLYSYWLKGGWWGSTDASGDFVPPAMDDDWDTTSVISQSTRADDGDDGDDGWTSESDGQRTPTQRSPRTSREGTPFADTPFSMTDLARLLHPQSPEEMEDAKALSAHLQSDGIMTRSRYRRMEQLQRARVLIGAGANAVRATAMGRTTKMSLEEEERVLEHLLLSRRQAASESAGNPVQWNQGAAGLGQEGPQCVVCQVSPRTIIVWPCRCLSLCDDCRVSLAMNNFDKCVCCRREVISFSRIFVP
ncbi:hypothetical protein S7711_01881 [Stachybotrys chartarum IBT 7711]|uniref:RING-type domain-containing protein n=1 Tax=Stachybotrys chartarum (strain CBS 109288 / IBT 7711) TaxID=1280523 RepID=A0A084AMQ8_STACB|nr:hypothetical protein S7711_01881 [Stachybotrys chartarum IBT 7711]